MAIDSDRLILALKWIIEIEGGYANDPDDPGGETKYGISKRAYPDEPIAGLTLERAREIYIRDYWNACRCNELPAPLDLLVFDCGVNQGVGAAIGLLQKSLGIKSDGVMGPVTLAHANDNSPTLAAHYLAERALRYAANGNFGKYGPGWMKRLFLLALRAQH